MTVDEIFKIIADKLEFDQLIKEYGKWVHISNATKLRHQKYLAKYVDG